MFVALLLLLATSHRYRFCNVWSVMHCCMCALLSQMLGLPHVALLELFGSHFVLVCLQRTALWDDLDFA